jgi:RNA polymerase sigma-70 factor (ECF subfamily)
MIPTGMREREIEDLLRRVTAGDREAAGEIARRYERPIRLAIRRRLGPELRARVDTDDIFQSTIAAALEDVPDLSFRGEGAFVAWLAAVAERRILMKVRHHRARKRDHRRDRPLEAAEGVPGCGTSPTRGAVRGEVTEGIRKAVARLPEGERRVVELHSVEGLSFQEVSDLLGLSGKFQAHRIFQRALKKIGDLYDPG